MLFVEGLGPVFPRWSKFRIGGQMLEIRRTLTCDNHGQRSQETDGQWIAVLSHAQHVVHERALLLRREIVTAYWWRYQVRHSVDAVIPVDRAF
jgi:hypothetical protein